MSTAFTSAGTTIQISATLPNPYTAAGFESVTGWQTIGEATDLGELGRTYNLVSHNPLGDRRTVKRKGSYNDGTVSMTVARDPNDAGQAIALAALDSDDSYSFLVTLQDGTELYFSAQVMSYTTNVGSVDQITTSAISLEIDNDIIEVAASV